MPQVVRDVQRAIFVALAVSTPAIGADLSADSMRRAAGEWSQKAAKYGHEIKASTARMLYFRNVMFTLGRSAPVGSIKDAAERAEQFKHVVDRYEFALKGMLHAGRFEEARQLIKPLIERIAANPATSDVFLKQQIVARAGLYKEACDLVISSDDPARRAQAEYGYRLDHVTALAEAAMIDEAINAFEAAQEFGKANGVENLQPCPTAECLTAYARANRLDLIPDAVPYQGTLEFHREMIFACCRLNRLDQAFEIATTHLINTVPPKCFATLAGKLVDVGRMEDAIKLLKAGPPGTRHQDPLIQTTIAVAAYRNKQADLGKQLLAEVGMPDARKQVLVEEFASMGRYDLAEDYVGQIKNVVDRAIGQCVYARCAAERGDKQRYSQAIGGVVGQLKKKPNPAVLIAIAEAHGAAANRQAMDGALGVAIARYQEQGNAKEDWLDEMVRVSIQHNSSIDLGNAFRIAKNANKRSAGHLAVSRFLLDRANSLAVKAGDAVRRARQRARDELRSQRTWTNRHGKTASATLKSFDQEAGRVWLALPDRAAPYSIDFGDLSTTDQNLLRDAFGIAKD